MSSEKAELIINIGELIGDCLIARSQGKRLFTKIEPFDSVLLDFSEVRVVGQGFADEVFRVYPSKNKNVKIGYVNANDDVAFMIKRSLPK